MLRLQGNPRALTPGALVMAMMVGCVEDGERRIGAPPVLQRVVPSVRQAAHRCVQTARTTTAVTPDVAVSSA